MKTEVSGQLEASATVPPGELAQASTVQEAGCAPTSDLGAMGREAKLSPPSNAEVKNPSSWCLTKHREGQLCVQRFHGMALGR
jgi:hypothetical protein